MTRVHPIQPPTLPRRHTALRVEIMTPRAQCPRKPTDLITLFETVTGRARHWGSHGVCSSPCNCAGEPDRVILAPTVIREDEEGHPWLMQREEGGWGEHGRRLRSWASALEYRVTFGERIERDADSRFIRVYPEARA